MITGIVNSRFEPTLRLAVLNSGGQRHDIKVVVDTGFNGSLTLPASTIAQLGLVWRTRANVILANGSQDQTDMYAGAVLWDGTPRNILIESAETEPLLGTRLMRKHSLHVNFVDSGTVEVNPLP